MFARITRALRAAPQTPDAEALAQFLCVDLALEPFDHISRPKYLADANSILRKFALSTPSASAGPQADAAQDQTKLASSEPLGPLYDGTTMDKQQLDAGPGGGMTTAHPQPQQADGRGAVKHAFRAVDELDWRHLESFIPDSGHGRFWKAVFAEVRAALQQSPATDNAPVPTEDELRRARENLLGSEGLVLSTRSD